MSSSELLDRPPASAGDIDALAGLIAAAAEQGRGDAVSDENLQKIVLAAIKIFAERFQAGERNSPVGSPGATATDTLIFVTALLKSANLELFELGMWQSWSGSR